MMAQVAWGSKDKLEMFRKIQSVCASDPILKNKMSYADFERDEQQEDGFRKLNRLVQVAPVPIDYLSTAYYQVCLMGGVSKIRYF